MFELIRSLDYQISSLYGRTISTLETLEDACEFMSSGKIFSDAVSAQAPLVLLLDSIDQLNNANNVLEKLNKWVPGLGCALPSFVHVVISMLPAIQEINLISQVTDRYEASTFKNSITKNNVIYVTPLDTSTIRRALPIMFQNLESGEAILPFQRKEYYLQIMKVLLLN